MMHDCMLGSLHQHACVERMGHKRLLHARPRDVRGANHVFLPSGARVTLQPAVAPLTANRQHQQKKRVRERSRSKAMLRPSRCNVYLIFFCIIRSTDEVKERGNGEPIDRRGGRGGDRPSAVAGLRDSIGYICDALGHGGAPFALAVKDAGMHEEHPLLVLFHQLLDQGQLSLLVAGKLLPVGF